MIRLQQIKKYFQDKAGINEVLRGIDLDVMEGEFVSIMGPSGAGKSLLLSILGMYDSAWQGEYFFLDQAIHRLKPKQRGEHNKRFIGFVFHQFSRFRRYCYGRRAVAVLTLTLSVLVLFADTASADLAVRAVA